MRQVNQLGSQVLGLSTMPTRKYWMLELFLSPMLWAHCTTESTLISCRFNYPFEVEHTYASSSVSSLSTKTDGMRVMTLNCFNLDPRIESADKVMNPRTDVDDDHGDGRFLSLAKAIVGKRQRT